MWRQNLNALKWVQREKVGITGDRVGCPAIDSEFEKLIVAAIAANLYSRLHVHPHGFASQRSQKDLNFFLILIPAELFSAQDFIQLREYRERQQDLAFSQSYIEGLAGL